MYRFNHLMQHVLRNARHEVRFYSREHKRQTFLSRLYENFREEMAKNKEMKESLKKFREEAEKLEQSEALKAARQKFETVEKEASKGSEVFKEKFSTIKEKVQGVIDEAGKTEIVKKAGKISEEIGKTTHTISEKAQEISKTGAFQSISEATRAVKQEIDTTSMQGIY
jgi:import inner membrane translocase subunit TIM44